MQIAMNGIACNQFCWLAAGLVFASCWGGCSSAVSPQKQTVAGKVSTTAKNSIPVLGAVALAAKDPGDSDRKKNVSFDDIKFEMKKTERFKRSMLTEKIEDLEGRKIRIKGYMLPSFQEKGITQFVLVRDNMECCFGPGAALFDCIIVEMKQGKSTSFQVRPISVEGVFAIKPFKGPDGKHLAIYHLTGEKVGS